MNRGFVSVHENHAEDLQSQIPLQVSSCRHTSRVWLSIKLLIIIGAGHRPEKRLVAWLCVALLMRLAPLECTTHTSLHSTSSLVCRQKDYYYTLKHLFDRNVAMATQCSQLLYIYSYCTTTVEPPRKGHFGEMVFVLISEVVPISEVNPYLYSIHHFTRVYELLDDF